MYNIPVVYVYLKFIISILCEKHKVRVTIKTTKLMAAFFKLAIKDSAERRLTSTLSYLCNNQLKLYWKRKKWVVFKVQFSRRAC